MFGGRGYHKGLGRGRRSFGPALLRLTAACLVWCSGIAASAQLGNFVDRRNVHGNRLRLSFNDQGILTLNPGTVAEHLQWNVSLASDYSADPFVLEGIDTTDAVQGTAALLSYRTDIRILGSIGILDRYEIGLEIPFTLAQERTVVSTQLPVNDIESSGLNDIVITPRVRILDEETSGVALAFGARLRLPTAQPSTQYFGERQGSAMAEFAASKSLMGEKLRVAANLGALFRKNLPMRSIDLNIDHELQGRLGASYDFGVAHVDLALEGFTELKNPFNISGKTMPSGGSRQAHTGSEVLLAAGYPVNDTIEVFAGGGTQIDAGYFVPAWRAFAGVRYRGGKKDTDKDKVPDDRDGCINEPEDRDGFEDHDGCPDPDNDGDGVPDVDDGTPDEPEDKDGFEDEDGIPELDNDGDGILDEEDECPNDPGPIEQKGCNDKDKDGIGNAKDKCLDQPEDKDGFEDEDGCPDVDNDNDGVLDEKDECRDEAGPMENRGCPDTDKDGDGVVDRLDNCPDEPGAKENQGCKKAQKVVIRGCQIELKQKVYFSNGRARILARSFPVLDNLAEVMAAKPQVKKVRIEGHTDNTGDSESNIKLSQDRAQAVVTYLVGRQIEESRLKAQGFGESKPIDNNTTRAGRANNRRVEAHIADCQETQEVVETTTAEPEGTKP